MNTVKFHEHIIRISEPGVSRNALWEGLLEYVRRPEDYVEHMVGSRILSEEMSDVGPVLKREIDFGNFKLTDRVIIRENESILTLVDAGPNWKSSSLLIRIEEPEAGAVFLRFVYEEEKSDEEVPAMFVQLRRQAYEAKDQQLVEGVLNALVAKASR